MIIAAALFACALWVWVCNEMTSRDRHWLIDRLYAGDDWRERRAVLDRVSYGSHVWRRISFRDPWAAYPDWARPDFKQGEH